VIFLTIIPHLILASASYSIISSFFYWRCLQCQKKRSVLQLCVVLGIYLVNFLPHNGLLWHFYHHAYAQEIEGKRVDKRKKIFLTFLLFCIYLYFKFNNFSLSIRYQTKLKSNEKHSLVDSLLYKKHKTLSFAIKLSDSSFKAGMSNSNYQKLGFL